MKNVNKCSQKVEKYSRAGWRACDLFVSPRYQSWHKNNNAHKHFFPFCLSIFPFLSDCTGIFSRLYTGKAY